MAVASPYAVFRAADLGWPVAPPPFIPASRPAAPAAARPARPRKRASAGGTGSQGRRPSAARLATLIQGDLFQSLPLG
ncbi:MAG: hypothetical protein ACKO0M_06375 [Cyanobium sp.]